MEPSGRKSRPKPRVPPSQLAGLRHIGDALDLAIAQADPVFRATLVGGRYEVSRVEVDTFPVRAPAGIICLLRSEPVPASAEV